MMVIMVGDMGETKINILKRDFSVEKVKSSFSKVAWFYDFWSRFTEEEAVNKALEMAKIKNGEKVLEVAVGTGIVFENFVKLNPEGKNEGIDISDDMLKRAKKRLKGVNNKSYNLNEGNALNLPYQDQYFDVIINNYMLDLFPEEKFDEVLREFNRVLKPGGRLVITSMSFGEKWYNRIWFYIAKYFPYMITYCRPIKLEENIKLSGFELLETEEISQNTFPSEVIKARKTK
jgi:ubiquinone/menaquinone biosynthesis C-methylase UbiE